MTTPAPSSRQRWLVPVVAVVLSVTVGAGLLAREIYRRPDQPADETTASSATPSSASSGAPAAAGVVQMTEDARAHPQAGAVRRALETYFSAINERNYPQWQTVVSDERRRTKTAVDWKKDFRSTKDKDILIYRIERGAGQSLRVLVAFTSTQDPQDAPADMRETCLHWRLVLPMVVEDDALRIDTVDPGPSPEHEKC
ncbi:hypothetical protein Amsp01_101060 [Amycolatopsis sp. NBRC 101858]|uniref:hypothetical protein n=1 Tax=Amycolatopsis sp. NBRC 101858 TaxID=3032200 RepID=UPI0024A22DDB|nr:hypothetical protein [Amycolatopsis sp. NBRC 101858]GLY44083.1 hypothetical protein Amsp01_101060 [Amycolatopsis sp. NBRC 101858]